MRFALYLRPIARQLGQEAHAKTAAAFAHVVAVGIAESSAGYVEMSPGVTLGKFAEQGSGPTGATPRSAGIFYIGDIAFDLLAVFGPQRQAPEPFMTLLSGL